MFEFEIEKENKVKKTLKKYKKSQELSSKTHTNF